MKLPASSPLLRLLVAVLLLAIMLWLADWRAVLQTLTRASAGWTVAGLVAAACATAASAWRWHALAGWLGMRVGHRWAQLTYLRACTINALLPGAVVGGDLYRAYALQNRGHKALPARTSVILDRLSGLWMLFVVAGVAATWGLAQGNRSWVAPTPLGAWGASTWLALSTVLLLAPAAALWLARRYADAGPEQTSWPRQLLALTRRPGLGSQFVVQMAASGVVQLFSVLALAAAGHALGMTIPYWMFAVAAAPTFLMAALPVGIGGWGTREAAAAVSLGVFGVPAHEAVAASMLYGLYALVQAMVGALMLAAPEKNPPTQS